MGFFEALCCESELVLGGPTAFLLLGQKSESIWTPIAAPLFNTYNRLGRIDMPGDFEYDKIDQHTSLILAFLQRCKTPAGETPTEETLGELVDEHLKEDYLSWEDVGISYTLVDERVYHAVANTVEAGLKTIEFDSSIDMKGLFDKAFDLPILSKAIYGEPVKHARWLSHPLMELCRYKSWHTQFQPFDLYADGPGQCTGYDTTDGAKPYCEKAREKYKDYPLILKAIEENAEYWKKLDTP